MPFNIAHERLKNPLVRFYDLLSSHRRENIRYDSMQCVTMVNVSQRSIIIGTHDTVDDVQVLSIVRITSALVMDTWRTSTCTHRRGLG